jgi:hypothetical protein
VRQEKSITVHPLTIPHTPNTQHPTMHFIQATALVVFAAIAQAVPVPQQGSGGLTSGLDPILGGLTGGGGALGGVTGGLGELPGGLGGVTGGLGGLGGLGGSGSSGGSGGSGLGGGILGEPGLW